MQATALAIPELLLFEPVIHGDARGYFMESFNARDFARLSGREVRFVQDNQSRSVGGVLRGLHYQREQAQGKLVRVLEGEILDVAVDLRRSSPYCGRWVSQVLSADNAAQLWVPEGFAHGFVTRSEFATVLYKVTDFYAPEHECCIRWDDPTLAIDWQCPQAPRVSSRDAAGMAFGDAPLFP